MPFGKYKHTEVCAIPKGYLRWLRDTMELRGPLRDAVAVALGEMKTATPERTDQDELDRIDAIVTGGL
jgi:hypothetical protein